MKREALLFALSFTTVIGASCSQGGQEGVSTETGGAGAVGTGGSAAVTTGGGSSTCPLGQTLCGTECVDLNTSLAHCGTCEIACSPGQTCTLGQCGCPAGTELCGTVCMSTASMQTDANNCGTCGNVCQTGTACVAGQCACAGGRTDCSGTCVDLQSDVAHCGDCTTVCVDPQVCNAGVCSTDCDTGLTACSGSCVNLQTDIANCGACDTQCPADRDCVGGQCSCPAGTELCGNSCLSTASMQTDSNNCGACGVVCVGGQSCAAGSCVCPTGQDFCGGQCTNTTTDASNCGSCGNACTAGQTCENGNCEGGIETGGTGGGTGATGGTGAGGGTGASGGTGGGGTGASGGTGGVTGIDPAVFAPDIDGWVWEGTCDGAASDNRQCAILPENGSCNNNVNRDVTKTVHGDAGTAYSMEIEVRGLLGSRCYTGGTRRAGNTPVNWTGPNDGLYIGGTVPSNWWNTYEVHVQNSPPGQESTYYLNCYYDNPSPTIEFDGQTCTMEEVLEVGYTFDLPVMGNSTITFRINDQNCQAQMNCGHDGISDKTCPGPRSVDLSGMDPPATFAQPRTNSIGGSTYYPQWAYFDVKSVTEL